MNRLQKLFLKKEKAPEKLLSVFLTAGYPELECTAELVSAVEHAGADFIELGMPFSDPVADGPTIQMSSQQALKNGMNMHKILAQIKQIRKQSNIPMLMMGYFNPFMHYGFERLVDHAEEAGIDGFIIPDILPEDFQRFSGTFEYHSIGLNYLISPNTTPERIKKVADLTHDFIYCVSVTGVTGARTGVAASTISFLQSLKALLSKPYLVGFGISNPDDAATLARHCDGIIVGSAVIKILAQEIGFNKKLEAVGDFITGLKRGLKGVK